jgi:hypothetical protein
MLHGLAHRTEATVFVDGERVGSVADDPRLAPGVAAIAKAPTVTRGCGTTSRTSTRTT